MKQINAVNFTGTERFIVDSSGAFGEYTTIQEAVNAAQTAGGGAILINPGVYTENVTVTGDGISISGVSSPVAQTGGTSAFGVQILGSFFIDATSNSITFSANNVLFQSNGGSPAVHFHEATNNIASNWNSCVFNGMTSTAFDCDVNNGTTSLINCVLNAATGQKCMNLNGAAINVFSCMLNGNDTPSTIVDGKNFFVNCSLSDSFDISGNPGPFLVSGSIQLSIGTFSCAKIHTGATVFYVNSSLLSGAASGFIFEGNGPADSGTIGYGTISPAIGNTTIDPDLTVVGFPTLPFSTAGTVGTAIAGSARFDSSGFTVDSTGFVSLASSSTPVVQRFTTPGAFTYTPTAGMKYVTVEMCAGGGGGGSMPALGGGAGGTSGGGGGGAYAKFILTAAQVGVSLSGSVGAGGTGGASGTNPGNAGGNTTLATAAPWTLTGGNGGGAPITGGGTEVPGVSGGTVTTGTGSIILTSDGTGSGTGGDQSGASGGGNPFGPGPGQVTAVQLGVLYVNNGITPGSGSSGIGANGVTAATAGGNGANGIAIFTEYL